MMNFNSCAVRLGVVGFFIIKENFLKKAVIWVESDLCWAAFSTLLG